MHINHVKFLIVGIEKMIQRLNAINVLRIIKIFNNSYNYCLSIPLLDTLIIYLILIMFILNKWLTKYTLLNFN